MKPKVDYLKKADKCLVRLRKTKGVKSKMEIQKKEQYYGHSPSPQKKKQTD